MLTEEQKEVHKEFRKYLRTTESEKGARLNELINATENALPVLIREHIQQNFGCIYDDLYTVKELLSISSFIKSNDEILAARNGHISSKAIEAYIRFYASKHGIDLSDIQIPGTGAPTEPDDEENEQLRMEGRLTEAKVLRRQRNRLARQKCLEASGYTCYVCGFNFEKAYGAIGKNYLEVHHTKPLSTYDDEHPIPQSELCALCSNCHSMVHRKREVLDVDELKRVFETNKNDI